MAQPTSRQPAVMVTGDVTVDWHLMRQAQTAADPWRRPGAVLSRHAGGALLLADLLEAVLGCDPGNELRVYRPFDLPDGVRPGDRAFHHLYAIWARYPARSGSRQHAWRLDEVLGIEQAHPDLGGPAQAAPQNTDAGDVRLLIIDDANLGFRDSPGLWPEMLEDPDARVPAILLKLARPLGSGALWSELYRRHADRLVVLISVESLREMDVQISRGLSWERTAQDLAWELIHNPAINALSRPRALVVTLGAAGAFLIQRDSDGNSRNRLVFDPATLEGEWWRAYPGNMLGLTTVAATALAYQLAHDPDATELVPAIRSGLQAMRSLHEHGYRESSQDDGPGLSFPFSSVAAALRSTENEYAAVDVPGTLDLLESFGARQGTWSILSGAREAGLDELASEIVHQGVAAALDDVPLGRFGHLVTVDRREIESYRSIRNLISEYALQRQSRPISLAVFGAPGAGKSFGVTQVAESVLPGQIQVLTFNLSQFDSPDDLFGAFHQIRDVGLSGKLPLVFWDEFDSALGDRPYGWLSQFLAPMQDGSFLEGQIEHPLGRAIFVFAGGTSSRFENFGEMVDGATFRAAKGPDFLSRLKGFVNVMGPDPQPDVDAPDGKGDPFAVVRRAILLRSIVERIAPQIVRDGRVEIDPGVLRGFLNVRRYKHGVRSMESIVAMSTLTGHHRFERSSLPPAAQLELHVDCREFMSHVQQLALAGDLLERLADETHAVYREMGLDSSFADVDYANLPEDVREQNRAVVRDIPARLAAIGYVMLPAREQEPPAELPEEVVEELAAAEHHRYVRQRLAAGWRYGKERDDRQRTHPALVYWHAGANKERLLYTETERGLIGDGPLAVEEKEKDRVLVRAIPRILARAGYVIRPSSIS